MGKTIKAGSPHFAAARCAYATHLNPATLKPRHKNVRCTDRMTLLKQKCDGLRSIVEVNQVRVGEMRDGHRFSRDYTPERCAGKVKESWA